MVGRRSFPFGFRSILRGELQIVSFRECTFFFAYILGETGDTTFEMQKDRVFLAPQSSRKKVRLHFKVSESLVNLP